MGRKGETEMEKRRDGEREKCVSQMSEDRWHTSSLGPWLFSCTFENHSQMKGFAIS